MRPFTYKSYLYYKRILEKRNNTYCLNDIGKEYEYEEYEYEEEQVIYPHDKIFKEVLDNKKEIVYFLNKTLELENTKNALKEENIEKYNRKFIAEEFYNMEADVVYKKKDQNIFFLIEHQSRIDCIMAYRILKYNMAIMDSAIDKRKLGKKDYKLPKIYSFVIYTGDRKWDKNNNLEDLQEKLKGVKEKDFTYFKVIDINNYTKKELLIGENLLSKIMLLEKAKNIEELEDNLKEIISDKLTYEQKIFLKRIIKYILKNKISDNKFNELIKELDKKEKKGESLMFVEIIENWLDEKLTIVDKREKEVDMKERKVQEKEQEVQEKEQEVQEKEQNLKNDINRITLEMIKNNIDETTIMKIIKINKSELNKIKNTK